MGLAHNDNKIQVFANKDQAVHEKKDLEKCKHLM